MLTWHFATRRRRHARPQARDARADGRAEAGCGAQGALLSRPCLISPLLCDAAPSAAPLLRQAALYAQLQAAVVSRRVAKQHDEESQALCARLLELNPEVLTAWNFRRDTLRVLCDGQTAEREQQLLSASLRMSLSLGITRLSRHALLCAPQPRSCSSRSVRCVATPRATGRGTSGGGV